MITLNDYLYSGDTIFRILQQYTDALRKEARKNHNEIDMAHSNFLILIKGLLEHNDFLTVAADTGILQIYGKTISISCVHI